MADFQLSIFFSIELMNSLLYCRCIVLIVIQSKFSITFHDNVLSFRINFKMIEQNKFRKRPTHDQEKQRKNSKSTDAEHRTVFKMQLITVEVKSRELDNVFYKRNIISEAIFDFDY